MPIKIINNIPIYYEQHGEGEDLVLIGGMTSDHQVWKSAVRLFAPHFRVLIFDNRGAGQSGAPDFPYTMEMMADDTLKLMDALNISRAHIVGHSMGGAIAQQIALTAPDKINKMVLVCSRAKISAIGNMLFSMREKLQAAGMEDDFLAQYVMPFLFSEAFLQNVINVKGFTLWSSQNPYPQTAIGYRNQLHATRTRDFTAQLNLITTPTLVVSGAEDILSPAVYGEEISKRLKNGSFVVIPNCAHMPHAESPKVFFDVVMGFLR
ncbi:MAG: alpha/beta hydrolase [Gammaproteobacteria bacterium]|nr:alpha/beta hydrolase [Gammaproteobacteria bacterium]